MMQLINPKTGARHDCEVMVCRDHFIEVVLKGRQNVVRADYDNICWTSPDWFNREVTHDRPA